jgi:hypothetical protein
MFSFLGRRVGLFSLAILLVSGSSLAKLVYITLEELVQTSVLIAYGKSAVDADGSSARGYTVVLFEPSVVLKGVASAKDARIPICNDPDDVETYDLRSVRGPYIVFAMLSESCYAPVRGIRSVVLVNDAMALTGNIEGQPRSQAVTVFLEKVRALISSQSSR